MSGSTSASAFASSVKCLRALEQLYRRGESQTEQGHAIRAQLEGLWTSMSIEEQDLLDALSSDLATAGIARLRTLLRSAVLPFLAVSPASRADQLRGGSTGELDDRDAQGTSVLGSLLDVCGAAAAVAAHRRTALVDAEVWHNERARLAEVLDLALARAWDWRDADASPQEERSSSAEE